MKQVLAIPMAALLLTAIAADDLHASDAARAIEAVNQEFEAAFGRADAAGLAAIYTPDGQLLPPNSRIVSGLDDIEAFWQGALDSGVQAAELDTVELDQQGDTAIEIGLYVLKTGDGVIADEGKYIVVWKKQDNAWKYHRDMWSSARAAIE